MSPNYHQTSNIRYTLIGSRLVDHSDVVGAAPNHIFIHDWTPGFCGLSKNNSKTRREKFKFWEFGTTYIRNLTVVVHIIKQLTVFT